MSSSKGIYRLQKFRSSEGSVGLNIKTFDVIIALCVRHEVHNIQLYTAKFISDKDH